MDNLDLVSASGELLQTVQGHGTNRKALGLKLPDFPLRIAGLDLPLRPAMDILERSLLNECHRVLGIDVLNRAQRVTIEASPPCGFRSNNPGNDGNFEPYPDAAGSSPVRHGAYKSARA